MSWLIFQVVSPREKIVWKHIQKANLCSSLLLNPTPRAPPSLLQAVTLATANFRFTSTCLLSERKGVSLLSSASGNPRQEQQLSQLGSLVQPRSQERRFT